MLNCILAGQLTQHFGAFFNINNVIFLSHDTLKNDSVCSRTQHTTLRTYQLVFKNVFRLNSLCPWSSGNIPYLFD